MGEMSELMLGFSASDMFCRDLDAAMRGRPFVSSPVTGEEEELYDCLPEMPRMADLLEPADPPMLSRFALPRTNVNERKVERKMEKNITTKVITGKCRLSYEHLFEPHMMEGASKAKYGACIVIPKTDKATIAKIQAAVDAAVEDGIKNKWKGKRPANLKLPLRDGDKERDDDETFVGCAFVNANSDRAPGIVDLARNPIMNREEVYSGCYCRFSINFYPFSVNGNNGVACGLNNVQKVADGEPLTGRSRAEDDFGDDYTGDLDDIL